MYKKDQYVVYKHDVCKIKNIKENKGNTYYVMTPIDDDSLIIDIPTDNKNGFLRDIISKENAINLIKKISKIKPIENINEKNLEGQYKEMLKNNDYESLIKIIKTTYLRNEYRLKNKKKITEKDNAYFELAEKYLHNELAISLNMSLEEVKNYIFDVVSKITS